MIEQKVGGILEKKEEKSNKMRERERVIFRE